MSINPAGIYWSLWAMEQAMPAVKRKFPAVGLKVGNVRDHPAAPDGLDRYPASGGFALRGQILYAGIYAEFIRGRKWRWNR